MSSFRSVNSSIGWLGTAAFRFPVLCFLRKSSAAATTINKGARLDLSDTCDGIAKKLGSTIKYISSTDVMEYNLSVLVLADASRKVDFGQLGLVAGLLIGTFAVGSIFHTLSW